MANNIWDDIRLAVSQSQDTLRAADDTAQQMAHLLRGRLRQCRPYTLKMLKRELQQFDAIKQEWKP